MHQHTVEQQIDIFNFCFVLFCSICLFVCRFFLSIFFIFAMPTGKYDEWTWFQSQQCMIFLPSIFRGFDFFLCLWHDMWTKENKILVRQAYTMNVSYWLTNRIQSKSYNPNRFLFKRYHFHNVKLLTQQQRRRQQQQQQPKKRKKSD